ncbi:MAG: YybH family protein [Verrucomicrobiota bacterium]
MVSFGTVCFRADTLEELEAIQWRFVWPNTRDFEFDYSDAVSVTESDQAVIAAGWSSTGFRADGSPFPRRGRATLVLRRELSGWRAVHTHFSLSPVSQP